MTPGKYYKIATLYPSIVTVLVTVIFSIIDNYNYRSEWLTAESVLTFTVVFALGYCVLLSLLSLTIFLTRLPKIQGNNVFTFLSWFLLPLGFVFTVIGYELNFNKQNNKAWDSDLWYIVVLNLPFTIALIVSYYQYRKAYRHAS